MAKQTVKEPPAARQITAAKNQSRKNSKPIIIKGCGARFNGVYDPDELLLRLLLFVAAVCLLWLLCL